jgi:hypothetical protein
MLIICTFIRKKSFKKLVIWIFFTLHNDMKTHDTKWQVTTQKMAWLNQLPNIHILKETQQVDG